MASADRICGLHGLDRVDELDAVDGDRNTRTERDGHGLGLDLDAGIPVRDAHDGLDDLHARLEQLEILRLVRRTEHVRVGRVVLVGRNAVGQPAGREPLAHLLPAAELGDEGGIEPRLVDPQVLIRE